MNRTIRSTLAAASLAAASFAQAQTPPAAPAADIAIPAPQCENPGDVPTPKPGMNTVERFQRRVDDYRKCMMAYVDAQRGKAEDAVKVARAHQDAANGAVETYNNYTVKINEQGKKQ